MGAWFVDILLTQWKTQFQDNPCVNMNHFGTKNWAKQQEAELAEEQDSVDRIRKALEEARR